MNNVSHASTVAIPFLWRAHALCIALLFICMAWSTNAISDSSIDPTIFTSVKLQHPTATAFFYQQQNQQSAWTEEDELNDAGNAWLRLLEDSEVRLPIYTGHIHALLKNENDESAMMADVLLTDALIEYVTTIVNSQTYSHEKFSFESAELMIEKRLVTRIITADDACDFISHYKSNSGLVSLISALTPQHPTYAQLRKLLKKYDTLIAGNNAWQPMPRTGPTLKQGDQHLDVKTLRNTLILYGDLKEKKAFSWRTAESRLYGSDAEETTKIDTPENSDYFFDVFLVDALKHFQQRHGLETTGTLGKLTRSALSLSPADRKKQIIANMQRWRELPSYLGSPYIMINVPDFSFKMMEGDRPMLEMKTIIGKPTNQTPLLISRVSTVIFNPYWSVPNSIARKEILADLKKDPLYLSKNHFETFVGWDDKTPIDGDSIDWSTVSADHFPYRFQQVPGDFNALGYIKFDFPNSHSVYMHDTPARNLFTHPQRALSHGCIRLEKPQELAQLLLAAQPPWDKEKIDSTIVSAKNTYVKLDAAIPVYVVYWTAWVGDDGEAQFRHDLYDLDHISTK